MLDEEADHSQNQEASTDIPVWLIQGCRPSGQVDDTTEEKTCGDNRYARIPEIVGQAGEGAMDGHQAKEKPPTNQGYTKHVMHMEGNLAVTETFIDSAEDEEEGRKC